MEVNYEQRRKFEENLQWLRREIVEPAQRGKVHQTVELIFQDGLIVRTISHTSKVPPK